MTVAARAADPAAVAAAPALAPRIAGRAGAADRGEATLAPDIDDLRAAGLLRAPLAVAAGGVGLTISPGDLLGGPGDYHREPHFHGGVWRYAAAQLGGLEALVEAMRRDLAARGRLSDPHQAARFAHGAMATRSVLARWQPPRPPSQISPPSWDRGACRAGAASRRREPRLRRAALARLRSLEVRAAVAALHPAITLLELGSHNA